MTLDDFRTTYAWNNALDLAPHLVRVAEQLPEGEANGLGSQLRVLAAEVPGSVAGDLVTDTHAALGIVLHAVATLEVIERVYPALDTAAARAAADTLATRAAGANFAEQQPSTAPAPAPDDAAPEPAAPEVAAPEAAAPAPTTPLADQSGFISPAAAMPTAPAPAVPPTAVPVLAEAAPTSVPVTPAVATEVQNVLPNSPQ